MRCAEKGESTVELAIPRVSLSLVLGRGSRRDIAEKNARHGGKKEMSRDNDQLFPST